MEKKTFIAPPPYSSAAEDPAATKRPAPPPTEEEMENMRRLAIKRAGVEALRERQVADLHEQGEEIRLDSVAGPAVASAEGELEEAFAHPDAATFRGLNVDTIDAPAAGIEDIEAHRRWLKRKLEGAPSTEAPPKPPEDTK